MVTVQHMTPGHISFIQSKAVLAEFAKEKAPQD